MRRTRRVRGRRASAAARWAGILLATVACGDASPPPAAPVQLRGAVVIEPPEIRIGQTTRIELAVVTPPGHQLRPVASPGEVPGLWILEVTALPVERQPERWIHRTRYHVRARETGSFAWPAQTVEVEDARGTSTPLALDAQPFQVLSVSAEFPARDEPFGWRRPAPGEATGAPLAMALAGALAALLGVALVALVRRVRAREPFEAQTATDVAAPWRAVQATLAAAAERAAAEPIRSANLSSAALRLYVTRRFGIAADVATTEELSAREVPLALTTRWPTFLSLLRRLDALRFRPLARTGDPSLDDELRAAIREAQSFVMESAPQGDVREEPTP